MATVNLAVQKLKTPNKVPDHKIYLDIIMRAAGQINNLIADLLNVWQPGEMQLEKYAIDAMRTEKRRLILITRSMNRKCIIEIEDNGIGISKANLKDLFTPYYTNKVGGMGLSFEGIQQSGE